MGITTIVHESSEPLIDLKIFKILGEPLYFKQGLSSTPKMLVRKTVGEKLLRVQCGLPNGFSLKVFDAFRPKKVQEKLYKKYWAELQMKNPQWNAKKLAEGTEKFVFSPYLPEIIPPHVTGGAVDVTLIDGTGNELDMGTAFDAFCPESAPFFYDIHERNPKVSENRRILRTAMEQEGFTPNDSEWWHFDYGNHIWALKSGALQTLYGEYVERFQ